MMIRDRRKVSIDTPYSNLNHRGVEHPKPGFATLDCVGAAFSSRLALRSRAASGERRVQFSVAARLPGR
jgi:hypothetical protein